MTIQLTNPRTLSIDELQWLQTQLTAIYLEEERDIWPDDGRYQRVSIEELKHFLAEGELVLASNAAQTIIGCIRVYQEQDDWYFGLLCTRPEYRHQGIGSTLVAHAEQFVVSRGGELLYIELLTAKENPMPNKIKLKNWYLNKSYTFVRCVPFHEKYASKIGLLTKEIHFEVMSKRLINL